MPFDIPESWKWVYIGELFQHNTGKALNSSNKEGTPYTYITTSNVYWNRFELDNLKTMLYTEAELEKCSIAKGDLLVLEGGDVGRAAVWNYDTHMRIQNHIHRLRPYSDLFIEFYYYIFMLYKGLGQINGKGIGIKGLSANALHRMIVPLPPLAEQKRIVAKIEELLPYIDRYEKAWSKLEDFNKRFPDDMQKSVLQMAIQGKLVEQRPEEGTGEELYRQIQAEKQSLIKDGKIKKEKPLHEISDDEIPFDIPESWKWVYIGDLFQHNTGKALNSSNKEGSPYSYITTSNVYWNRFELEKLKTMLYTEAELEKCSIAKGDLLVLEGGDVGRAAIWNFDTPMRIQNHIHRLRPYSDLHINFYYYIFMLYKGSGLINGKGIGIKGLSASTLHRLIVPLPPLTEQKRIVAKLDELLPLCERLKQ